MKISSNRKERPAAPCFFGEGVFETWKVEESKTRQGSKCSCSYDAILTCPGPSALFLCQVMYLSPTVPVATTSVCTLDVRRAPDLRSQSLDHAWLSTHGVAAAARALCWVLSQRLPSLTQECLDD